MFAMYQVYFGRHVVGVSGVSFVFKCRLVYRIRLNGLHGCLFEK